MTCKKWTIVKQRSGGLFLIRTQNDVRLGGGGGNAGNGGMRGPHKIYNLPPN